MSRARLILFGAFVFLPSAAWAQGPVGPEFRVNTYTGADQQRAAVAADSAGNFVVVWASPGDGFATGIFGQRFSNAGVPVGPEFQVNTYVTGTQTSPAVASDGSGNFVVVWRSDGQDGWDEGVFGQRFDASGSPLGAEFRVNAFTSFDQVSPAVAADSAGNFVVVWSSDSDQLPYGGPPIVMGRRYASSGSPLGTAFRVNDSAVGSSPAVAMDPVGNFVVAWTKGGFGQPIDIAGRRFASTGAPLGSEFLVNTTMNSYEVGPDVAVDASGNFVVVWFNDDEFGGLFGDLFGQRFASSGVPLGPEFRVTTSPYDQLNPRVASDAAGNFVVVWRSYAQDGSGQGVFGQRYASDGTPLGTEFRVNTHTTVDQKSPAVAADPAGNFVVVWESQAQDGSGLGIFGQRYRPIVPVELMRFGLE